MDAAEAVNTALLDQMYAELRQYREDIETIMQFGLPDPDDAGAAERQAKLIQMLACVVATELKARAT